MRKKVQSEFDKNIKDGFDAIRSVVTTIAKKEASKYELKIYNRLKAFCDEQIDVMRKEKICEPPNQLTIFNIEGVGEE